VVGPLELFYDLAVLWLLAARGDRPQYRRTSGLFVTGTAACAILLDATALLAASARVLAWGLLGETLTSVVGGLADQPFSALTLAVGLVAVVVGFGAWWTYFDFARHRLPRPGAGARPRRPRP
jgi:hypothetical protein